jgi:bifunctional non-homologous end joining protein LigD
VGTGFDERLLNEITPQLRALQTDVCPFGEVPKLPGGAGRLRWVRPELVAQVAFHEWTEGGGIRAPVFLGLRDDKDPRDVIREGA